MNKLILCTNINDIANNFSYLLEGKAEVHVFPRYNAVQVMRLLKEGFQDYSYFVLGVNVLTEEDWTIFSQIKHIPIDKLLLVRQLGSKGDIQIAREFGVKKVLIDPLEKVKYAMDNCDNVIDYLCHSTDGEECHHYKGDDLLKIENGLYFHTKELWVGNFANKSYLSDLECNLLKLFIEYEGEVVLAPTIANTLWDGQIELSSIRKLVKRLP
ncbi:hypothetical protein [Lysinibacillus sp. NPDC092081]|uniref:hypothetical protein n=1 Tax=Lysinibacillus sp. NPDC092081 TaxID=3364131 RepID=UPI0038131338